MTRSSGAPRSLRFSANLGMLFTEVPFLERFEAAAKAGFRAVEFPLAYEHPVAVLRDVARRAGVDVVLINLPAGEWAAGDRGLACDPGRREVFRRSVPLALEVAAALDCPRANCLAGILPAGYSLAQGWQVFEDNLVFAADAFHRAGVELLIEFISQPAMPGFLLSRWDDALGLLRKLEHPALRLQFDLFHAQVMHGEVRSGLQTCLPWIGHVQVADSPGRHEPGTGSIDFDGAFACLEEAGYAAWVGCEYVPRGATVPSLDWLRRYQAGGRVSGG